MWPTAAFTCPSRSAKADGGRELPPVDRVEEAILATDRHNCRDPTGAWSADVFDRDPKGFGQVRPGSVRGQSGRALLSRQGQSGAVAER
jgi:hypothetical protein